MKRVSIYVGFAVALSFGLTQSALGQDDPDATMRVLDDVKDVAAVILEIGERQDARGGEHRTDDHRDTAYGDEHWAAPGGHDDLGEGDADHGDGKYEDRDVPTDE